MTKTEISGHSPKEVALIIMIAAIAFVFGVVGIGFAVALIHNPGGITFTGNIDFGQFVGVIIGVAVAGVAFIGQQLTARHASTIQAQTDQAWLDDKEPSKAKPPGG